MIHEVDEPPLGVPGELHFDDEEEEVERGGWAFIHFIIVSIITSWRMHQVLFKAPQCIAMFHILAGAGFQPVPGTSCSYCGIHDPATLVNMGSAKDFHLTCLPRLTATSASVGSATREETPPGLT